MRPPRLDSIWKYSFTAKAIVEIEMPMGANVLSFGNQNEKPTIWAEVDTKASVVKRKFYCITTGGYIPENCSLRFIGTALFFVDGSFVIHLYEEVA